jgi:hypothetical protein
MCRIVLALTQGFTGTADEAVVGGTRSRGVGRRPHQQKRRASARLLIGLKVAGVGGVGGIGGCNDNPARKPCEVMCQWPGHPSHQVSLTVSLVAWGHYGS